MPTVPDRRPFPDEIPIFGRRTGRLRSNIGFDGDMDTNIAIRTAVNCKNVLSFYAGGGIVADSDGSKEFAETLDKASSFTKTIKYFTRL